MIGDAEESAMLLGLSLIHISFSVSVTVIVCLPASPEVGLMEIQLSAREVSRTDAVQLWVCLLYTSGIK